MEITIKLKVILEVPDEFKSRIAKFKSDAEQVLINKLFSIYAVRNVIRLEED